MTKLSDTKTHLILRLANVRPIAMPGRIAKAGPGNKRTVDSLTRTGYIGTDGKLTMRGLDYAHRFLAAIRAAEMAAQADADAAPYTLNTDPTGLRPEATDAERMAHFARNIVADQEQRDADARDEVHGYARFLNMAFDLMGLFIANPEPGSRVIETEQLIKWQRRHGIVGQNTESWYLAFLADEAQAHADNVPTLTRKLARLAFSTMLDVFTPNGDAGVVSMVGRKDDRVYVCVSLGEGDRDASGWYAFGAITAGRDLVATAAREGKL